MRIKEKIAITAAAAILTAGMLSGCGENPAHAASQQTAAQEPAEPGLKIALLSSVTGIDDGSFVLDNYNGISDFISDHKQSSVEMITEETGEPRYALEEADRVAADYDVIICAGYQFSGITKTASEYPDKKFILVDSFPTDENGNETSADNIYAMVFKEQESGFLAGIAAALTTKTGKVAVICGMPLPSNINYQRGFEYGVEYSNKTYGTDAETAELETFGGTDANGADIGGNYVGSFSDMDTAKKIAETLIAQDCDVLFAAAGASGKGVLDAVKESKRDDWLIGSDTDRSRDGVAGSKNVVLTSVIKNMGMNDRKILEDIAAGTFKGGNYLLGADSGSTAYISAPEKCRLSDDAKEKLDEAFALLQQGGIEIQ